MEKLSSKEIRNRFLKFFENNQHKIVTSSPLVLENHPSLLFVNSGMVQFTPYFLGEKDAVKDFGNKMLVDTQKCIRTNDLDIVGKSKYHHTFFEMLGSWGIGAYSKEKAVELAFNLLTNEEYGFGLDPGKFIPTVFAGSDEAPADEDTIKAWNNLGVKRVSRLPASENWWAPGGLTGVGPCGPCTEVLYDRGPTFGDEEETPGLTDNPRYLEIWNAGVFMQYNRPTVGGKLEKLKMLSVDTGAGLERITTLLQGVDSNYETDLFSPIIEKILSLSDLELNKEDENIKFGLQRSADHLKASCFIIVENVYPSNKDQGFVLRRMLRRVVDDFTWKLKINPIRITQIIPVIVDLYKIQFPEIDQQDLIKEVIETELRAYEKVVNNTRNYIKRTYVSKSREIENPFDVYQSTGSSKELIEDLAKEFNLKTDFSNFDARLKKHQELSKGSDQRFKGGLANTGVEETKLHTTTHLLHKALRDTLGEHVQQMGSNINPQRLRFDFSHNEKMTRDQIKKVEGIINEKIKQTLPVVRVEMSKSEAEKSGALHFFKDKYGDTVSIYFIGKDINSAYSKEFCGGPHVKNTSEIGKVRLVKEEGVGKGVRRIRAELN
ncbi:alanine--tRNA ligase [bacterium]|nr:alanine--tRNA ligase [bacterium]